MIYPLLCFGSGGLENYFSFKVPFFQISLRSSQLFNSFVCFIKTKKLLPDENQKSLIVKEMDWNLEKVQHISFSYLIKQIGIIVPPITFIRRENSQAGGIDFLFYNIRIWISINQNSLFDIQQGNSKTFNHLQFQMKSIGKDQSREKEKGCSSWQLTSRRRFIKFDMPVKEVES